MKEFPFSVRAYAFPRVEVQANPEHVQSAEEVMTHFNVEVEVGEEDPKNGTIAVSVAIATSKEESKNPPYFFHIHCIGIFSNKEPGKKQAEAAYFSCKTMIVGAIREMLSNITARSPWGIFVLQPVSPSVLGSSFEFPKAEKS